MSEAIENLKLEPCCAEALSDIKEVLESAKILQSALLAAPFVTMFSSNPLGALYAISSTDWRSLTTAVKGVPEIARSRCRTIAQMHSMDHPGGDLFSFWLGVSESFD